MGKKKRYKTNFSATKSEHKKLESTNLKDQELKKIKTKMYTWLDEQAEIGLKIIPFNYTEFEKQFFKKDNAAQEKALSPSVESLFNDYITSLQRENRVSTASTYETARNSFSNYKKHLKIDQVNPDFLIGYEQWMIINNKSLTTIGFYTRALRAIFNMAIEKKIVDIDKYPFKKYTIPSPRKSKRSLKKEDLKKILNYKNENVVYQKAIDFWIFSYLCNGMNFKDIALLKNEAFTGDYIAYNRVKIKNSRRANVLPIRIPVNTKILEIINKWGSGSSKPKDYIFPILEPLMSQEEIEDAVYNFIDRTNTILKKIGTSQEISLKLTTYVARHSFATTLKRNNTSLLYISDAMGHSDPKTTIDYFGSFEDEDMKEIHKKLIDGMMD